MSKFTVIIASASNKQVNLINDCINDDLRFELACVTHHTDEIIDLCSNIQVDLLVISDTLFEQLSATDRLKHLPIHTKLAFTSNSTEFAAQAFEFNTIDLMPTQLTKARVTTMFNKFAKTSEPLYLNHLKQMQSLLQQVKHYGLETEQIIVKESGRIRIIDTNDIEWIAGAGNYVELHLGQETRPVLHRETLSSMLNRMAIHGFVRIHRSTLVKRRSIKELKPTENGDYLLTLKNGESLNLSRRYKQNMTGILC